MVLKLFGFILAFYLVLLSAIPCCAFDNCPDDKTEQTENHQPGDEDCGNCSPFFSCEGCAVATIVCEPARFELHPITQKAVYTVYLERLLPDTDYDFWQPPKLG